MRVGHPLAGRQQHRVGGRLLEPRPEPDVDAASAQLLHGVVGEVPRNLWQDPLRRLDQDPAHALQAGARVAVHRVDGEVLKLGQRLEARVAASDEDVGEELLAAHRVVGRVCLLERLDHVVSQPDRVGEALEADRVLVETGDRQRARDRADGNDELVVAQLLDLAVVGVELDRARRRIVAGDRAEAQVGALEDVAQRRDHVARLERSRRGLGQKRRVEHEVDVVDEDQACRLLRQQPLELACRCGSPEAPSGDDDVPGHDFNCSARAARGSGG